MTSLVDTIKWSSTDLKGLNGLLIPNLTGLVIRAPYRGANKPLPGMPGEVGTTKPLDAYDFPIPYTLGPNNGAGGAGTIPATSAAQRIQYLANLAALDAVFSTNLATITRRLSKTASPFYVDTTCNGEFLGRSIEEDDSGTEASGVLFFRNLDGAWS